MFKLQRSSPLPPSKGDFKSPTREGVLGRLIPTGWKCQFIFGIIFILTLGVVPVSTAQQSDTTRTTKELELKERTVPQPYHSERSTNSYLLPESGSYDVPEPTEYYTPPFMGQEYLDMAVAAYRKQLAESIANSPLFQFLSKIAPFVNNRFEFGVYQIYDLPIVDRDNPYLFPQTGNDE